MKIAVIGGGAAGMMCAATINELSSEKKVFLIERNESLGKKVIISGGGRCNLTTGLEDINEVLKRYPRGGKFLSSVMYGFSPSEVKAWFEKHGVPLKCEADLRVFPVSNKGTDVVGVFQKIFSESQTEVRFGNKVKKIIKENKLFKIEFDNSPSLIADKVVLAVGGQAYRKTGSEGEGYAFAESLGHKITELAASLHAFVVQEKWVKSLSGISFKNAVLSAGKRIKFEGPFVFTHSGVSGPAVFALSSLVAFEKFSKTSPLDIEIDLVPEITKEKLYKDIKSKTPEELKKSFKNYLRKFVPEAVAEVACSENRLPLEKKYAEVTDLEIKNIVGWLKGFPLHVIGKGAGDEFVTAGGVKLSEVDPLTMESKICPGLYFAGEILDIDGFTGGFNLQASWATGRRAGESISKLYG